MFHRPSLFFSCSSNKIPSPTSFRYQFSQPRPTSHNDPSSDRPQNGHPMSPTLLTPPNSVTRLRQPCQLLLALPHLATGHPYQDLTLLINNDAKVFEMKHLHHYLLER